MTSTAITEHQVMFYPTDDQIDFAKEYMDESGLKSVIVAVRFPGKQRGVWTFDQKREAVMDGAFPAIWTDRTSALVALDTGEYGNAMFRVHSNGHAHLVDEL